jgi:hypothetical protein
MESMDCTDGMSSAGRARPTEAQRPQLDRGTPGASAAREQERRRRNREARIRRRHPLIGGLLLAIGGAPVHEAEEPAGGSGKQPRTLSLRRLLRRTARSES